MLDALMHLAAQQQMAVGMVAAAVAGAATYALREVPAKLITVFEEFCMVQATIESTDPLFEHVSAWLGRQKAARKSSRLMAHREFDYDLDDLRWTLTLGRGLHLIWFCGSPVLLNRQINDGGDSMSKAMGLPKTQTLKFWTLGRSQKRIRAILDEAERIYKNDGKVRVWFWSSMGYVLADRREPRDLETVFLPSAQKARIVADVEAFIATKPTYRRRGTPYRRGYLFTGKPGTGKSSLIFALAARLGRDVFTLNLSSIESDNCLMMAVNEVGPAGVLLIEDIDAARVTHDRVAMAASEAPVAPGQAAPTRQGITLSGLLNALDGVASREGRITFITSNHPEQLDPALLRAGRVDVREEIAPMEAEAAAEMFAAFFPQATTTDFDQHVLPLLPTPAADLQNLFQGLDRGARAA